MTHLERRGAFTLDPPITRPRRSAIGYVASTIFMTGGGLLTGALGTAFTMSMRPMRSYSLQTLPSQ
jgi:hypothetical protein